MKTKWIAACGMISLFAGCAPTTQKKALEYPPLPSAAAPRKAVPVRLAITIRWTNECLKATWSCLEASPDFTNWTEVARFPMQPLCVAVLFNQPPGRFYRAVNRQ